MFNSPPRASPHSSQWCTPRRVIWRGNHVMLYRARCRFTTVPFSVVLSFSNMVIRLILFCIVVTASLLRGFCRLRAHSLSRSAAEAARQRLLLLPFLPKKKKDFSSHSLSFFLLSRCSSSPKCVRKNELDARNFIWRTVPVPGWKQV